MHAKTFDLLRLIFDARFHPGRTLSQQLNTSHAGMLLALSELEQLGLEVLRVPGRGYRLAEPYEWLDRAAVNALLGAHAQHFHLELCDVCASTNTLLQESARAGAPAGQVIACELQSAGRGRRGHTWYSGLGGSLTFSLLWRFAQGAAGVSGLSLATGVALARALARVGAADVQLKWPNDLLHAGRKLGGILIEVQAAGAGGCAAVIGIGLNLRLPRNLRDAIAQPVTDIASIVDEPVERNRVLACALVELENVLGLFARYGFAPLREEWTARHAHQDKAVTLSSGAGKAVEGVAAGVAEDGALLIETARGVERFLSGELSLRAN